VNGSELMITPHPLFNNGRVQIVTLAARHTLPVVYAARGFAEVGGLMSYGPDELDSYRLAGVYAAAGPPTYKLCRMAGESGENFVYAPATCGRDTWPPDLASTF
jgi:hypothetical protein